MSNVLNIADRPGRETRMLDQARDAAIPPLVDAFAVALGRFDDALFVTANGQISEGTTWNLAVHDGEHLVWVICNAAIGAWFTGPIGQDRLAAAVLEGIFHWRLYVFLFLIVLRPALPQARLCDATDLDARAMYGRIEVVMLLIMFTVKRLLLLEQVVWQLWMRNVIWLR